MGNSSSRTIAEMGISAKVNQASNASSETTCDSMNINSITQNIMNSNCADILQTTSGVSQDNNSFCKNASKQISISNQKADQDLQQQLTQVAEAKTKGVNLGNSSSAVTETNTQLNSAINLENSVSQSCSSHALNLNAIRQSITNANSNTCIQTVTDIEQNNISRATNECSLQSDQSQASSQVVKQTVSQTATATTEGFDPVALLGMVAIILLILFVGPAYTMSKIASAGLSAFLKVLMVVIILIFIAIYVGIIIEWFKPSINQYSEIPWYIKIPLYLFFGYSSWSETPDNYYELMKSEMIIDTNSTPHNDGIYIINYSSVYYIPDNLKDTINSETTLEEIKKLGLQNENLYGSAAKNNNGKVDDGYGYNGSYNPAEAKAYMENKTDDNDNPIYHAFEIICYVISKEGGILKLDNPITLFYDKLDETFWNYDSIKNPGCLDSSSDSENYTSCGISLPKSRTKCKTHDECHDGEFCGLGDIGCVSCDYCQSVEDGIYGREGTINPEESCIGVPDESIINHKKACGGVSGSKSLKNLLDDCKSCKGRILQQGEVYNEQTKKIEDGTNPWNKVNYYNYTKAHDIWENSYDSQGNIRFNDGKFEKRNGNSWIELGEMDYGFSSLPPSSSFTIDFDKTISDESEQNRIYLNSPITGNSEEKCIIRSVSWTEGEPNVTLGPPSLSTLSGNIWSSTGVSPGSCYNVGVDDKYKCIDKYEVMCQNFPARNPNLECDDSNVIDYTKTLVGGGEEEKKCAQLSLKDKITEDDWSECKDICCKPADEASEASEILFNDQVDCDYIPRNSIKIDQRFMPYNNNVVGIRMFRDYSEMGDKLSIKENLDKLVYWGWKVPLITAILWGLFYMYLKNKNNKSHISYDGQTSND